MVLVFHVDLAAQVSQRVPINNGQEKKKKCLKKKNPTLLGVRTRQNTVTFFQDFRKTEVMLAQHRNTALFLSLQTTNLSISNTHSTANSTTYLVPFKSKLSWLSCQAHIPLRKHKNNTDFISKKNKKPTNYSIHLHCRNAESFQLLQLCGRDEVQ